MSVLPATSTRTVADLLPYITDALQGRTDISTIYARYVKRAVQEICESNDFEELKVTGPTVPLIVQQSAYPVTYFMLDAGDDYVQIPSFCIYVNYPTNSVVSTIQYKTPAAIDPMTTTATQGLPSRWSRYGANILLGPTPNITYSVFMRYQRRHNFPLDDAGLPGTYLFIPPEWEQIVVYAAAEYIAITKRWNDQATFLHDKLFGDPEFQLSEGKRGRPGLIAARTLQIERDQRHSSRQLMVTVSRYNPR
jgi:hypothetical protein